MTHPTNTHENISISQIEPNLYLGNIGASYSITCLISHGITAIVSLSGVRHPEWSRPANRTLVPKENHYQFIPCDDSPVQDILFCLDDICDFIDHHIGVPSVQQILSEVKPGEDGEDVLAREMGRSRKVLVHCDEGVSRSPAIVIAYLMRKDKRSLKGAMKDVKRRRGCVRPNRNFVEQLKVWEKTGYKVWEDKEKEVPTEEYKWWLEKRDKKVMDEVCLSDV
ncbi:protein-tyrosine phosphatase-like protein [Triangularia verruculosa]|uniref:protein-tyrosine-phosphatase n=1 Tax=Triangularia verruculosa TaxID=2587418 RepID=A0AAN7AQI5_9PEZI|nr:protein-tyrosine phosphatase-like protein [Triangularia verruculosa]